MGVSQGAILSNKNNRNLQRKKNGFGLGKNGLTGKRFSGQKASINEEKMQKIARRSLWIEVVFYAIIVGLVFAGVYWWVG